MTNQVEAFTEDQVVKMIREDFNKFFNDFFTKNKKNRHNLRTFRALVRGRYREMPPAVVITALNQIEGELLRG